MNHLDRICELLHVNCVGIPHPVRAHAPTAQRIITVLRNDSKVERGRVDDLLDDLGQLERENRRLRESAKANAVRAEKLQDTVASMFEESSSRAALAAVGRCHAARAIAQLVTN